jgi:sugar lactone lactonase YvrE
MLRKPSGSLSQSGRNAVSRKRRTLAFENLEDRRLLTVAAAGTDVAVNAAFVSGTTYTLTAIVYEALPLPTGATAASPTGTVQFKNGNTLLSTAKTLTPSGSKYDGADESTATLTTTLPVGTDLLTASYTSSNTSKFVNSSAGISTSSVIETVAGNGTAGSSGLKGQATAAELYAPTAVATDSAGDLFIADYNNSRVLEVTHATGVITLVAGNGKYGYSGDGGKATAAELDGPDGIAVNSAGTLLFVSDGYNDRIREVNLTSGIITTVAGNGKYGYSGDGGKATAAELDYPSGIALNSTGSLLFIADTCNDRIREVNVSSGIITTAAGNGKYGFSGDNGQATAAELSYPSGVAVDSAGDLFIADTDNNRIREVNVSSGKITTVAGNGTAGSTVGANSLATASELYQPMGVAVDSNGNLFIADTQNDRVREVSAGKISTVAGSGTAAYNGDNITAGQVFLPEGVAVDADGDLFIADFGNERIRELATGAITVTVTSPV